MTKTILIVEDDPVASELIAYALNVEGYDTLVALNGEQGMSHARNHKPDLVVLDVMLPGMDGFEICRRLKAEPETAHMPILILSAKAQVTDVKTGQEMGAEIYLTKPLDPSNLVEQVQFLLGEES